MSDEPLFGWADTHAHLVAHLGFGGRGVYGAAWPRPGAPSSPDGPLAQLRHCTRVHGPLGLLPSLDGVGHGVRGFPEFDGWPRHTTQGHQQAHLEWVHRAVRGGLRLIVCLAVNNELLARRLQLLPGARSPTDDMASVEVQLAGMRAMVEHVDTLCGGRGRGWLEIADTPSAARRIVAAGRLAVVPGVEVDSLGGWHTPQQLEAAAAARGLTPAALVEELVQDLYDRGVRHVFPAHATDNAFAGAAVAYRTYDAVNYVLTGNSYAVESAPQELGISYRLDQDEFDGGGLAERVAYHGLAGLFRRGGPPRRVNWADTPGGHINSKGLTAYGAILVRELMRRGMMIDVDHLGHKSFAAVLDLAEAHEYPVVSGHTSLRRLRHGWRPALPDPSATFDRHRNADLFGTANGRILSCENNRSPDQIARIHGVGGMVSGFLYQRDVRAADGPVRNDCSGSARSFAQLLVELDRERPGVPIGIGSDVNGVGRLPGPRFGPFGAAGIRDAADQVVRRRTGPSRREETLAQHGGVRYADPLLDYRAHRFDDTAVGAPFTESERLLWEAAAVAAAGIDPARADVPPLWRRRPGLSNTVANLAAGLAAGSRDRLPVTLAFPRMRRPWPFYRTRGDLQLAAHLARTGEAPAPGDPDRVRQLAARLTPILRHWAEAEEAGSRPADPSLLNRFGPAGSGLYDAEGRLHRDRTGRRDFDVNLDGVAHYGLMPDLLHDLRSVGVPADVLAGVYHSADEYIRVWERCQQ